MSCDTRPANFMPLRPCCDISSDRVSNGSRYQFWSAGAHLAHRVEAEARPVGKLGIEPLPVHRPEPFGVRGDLGLEHAALGIEALAIAEDLGVFVGVGDVLGNLGDRVERIGRHERRAQARGLDGHLDVVNRPQVRARP